MNSVRGKVKRRTSVDLAIAQAEPEEDMNGNETLNELVNVVTSVTQGMDFEDVGQLSQIFPDMDMNFLKVAAKGKQHMREEKLGPMTRIKAENISEAIFGLLPKTDGDTGTANDSGLYYSSEKLSQAQKALLMRRRLAEYEHVLRTSPRPFLHNYSLPDVKPTVLNVVGSAHLGILLDLKKIGQQCPNVEYNPKRFAPCVMRLRKPKSTCLIFSSGRMIVSGCKSEKESKLALRRYGRIIQRRLKLDTPLLGIMHFEVQNISANAQLNFPVNIKKMAEYEECREFVSYEAELFPGLVFSLAAPKVKIVIFVTGALLMTGVKSEEELQIAMECIYPLCRKFRR